MPWSNQNGQKGPWDSGKNKKKIEPDTQKTLNKEEKKNKDQKQESENSPWGKNYSDLNRPSSFSPKNKNSDKLDLSADITNILKKGKKQINNNGYVPIISLFVFVLFLLWLFQCFYVVQQNEKAVQLWLGKPEDKIIGDGLHFRFWPFETYHKVPLTEQNISIGFAYNGDQSDSLMLSGDQNIVNVKFLVYYNISNPMSYLFNVNEPIATIRQVAESAMREVVGRRPIDDVYRDKREDVANDVLQIIQSTVNKYQIGVTITRISISEAAPPAKVAAAFNSVQQAEQERNRVIEEGNKIRATKLGLANGEAAKKRAEAQGEKAKMIEEARGQAARFKSLAEEEKNAPKIVRYRLYMKTLGDLLFSKNKLILEDKAGVLSHLPLNQFLNTAPSTKEQTIKGDH